MIAEKIKENIVRFNFLPLNRWNLYCYLLIKENHNYLIDTGCGSNDVIDVLIYMKENNIKNDIIVINTHYHWDHIWGNKYIDTNMIIAHEKCYQMIKNNNQDMLINNKEYINGEALMRLPNITFNEDLYLKEDNLLLFFSPGHTVDQISIYDEKENVMFVGDNIGDDEVNIVPCLECDKDEYELSLKRILNYNFDMVLSGHNEIQNKDFIKKIINELH